ncbi:MAG: hypothetical protein HOI66_13800, partial [Verrucomicrobia bacterium]|nr:hypothetical protein [Verrucomicrobiota bacterium]
SGGLDPIVDGHGFVDADGVDEAFWEGGEWHEILLGPAGEGDSVALHELAF